MEGPVVVGHWIADDAAPRCAHCCEKFTGINRKHHCRLCGNVFCAKCVEWRLTHAELGLDDQKGCQDCHQFLTIALPLLLRGKTFIYYTEERKRVATVSLHDEWSHLLIRPLPLSTAPTPATPLLLPRPSTSTSSFTSSPPPASSSYSSSSSSSSQPLGDDDELLDLARFNCVLDGQQTPVFQSYQPHPLFFLSSFFCGAGGGGGGGGSSDDVAVLSPFCFSVLFGGREHGSLYGSNVRTVDLQAETLEDKQAFVAALTGFARWRATQGGRLFGVFRAERRKMARRDDEARRRAAEGEQRRETAAESRRARDRYHASRDAMRDKYGLTASTTSLGDK